MEEPTNVQPVDLTAFSCCLAMRGGSRQQNVLPRWQFLSQLWFRVEYDVWADHDAVEREQFREVLRGAITQVLEGEFDQLEDRVEAIEKIPKFLEQRDMRFLFYLIKVFEEYEFDKLEEAIKEAEEEAETAEVEFPDPYAYQG